MDKKGEIDTLVKSKIAQIRNKPTIKIGSVVSIIIERNKDITETDVKLLNDIERRDGVSSVKNIEIFSLDKDTYLYFYRKNLLNDLKKNFDNIFYKDDEKKSVIKVLGDWTSKDETTKKKRSIIEIERLLVGDLVMKGEYDFEERTIKLMIKQGESVKFLSTYVVINTTRNKKIGDTTISGKIVFRPFLKHAKFSDMVDSDVNVDGYYKPKCSKESYVNKEGKEKCVILLHGVTGNSTDEYIKELTGHCTNNGFNVIAVGHYAPANETNLRLMDFNK